MKITPNKPITDKIKSAGQAADLKEAVPKKETSKQVFPLKLPADGILRSQLLNLVPDSSEVLISRLKNEEKVYLELTLAQIKSDDSQIVGLTKTLDKEFTESKLDLQKVLEKRISSADDTEQKIILNMMLVIGKGTSDFISRILEYGEKDKRYSICLDLVKSLPEPDQEAFFYNVNFYNWDKVNNLASALLKIQESDFILDLMQKSIDDDNLSKVQIERKQLLMLVLMKKIGLGLELNRTMKLFNSSVTWGPLHLTSQLITKRFKDNAPKIFQLLMKNEELSSIHRSTAMGWYIDLLHEKAIPELKEMIANNENNPVIVDMACYGFTQCGKEGESAIKEIIENDIKEDRASSVLANLLWSIDDGPIYNKLGKKIFSKNINLTDALLKIQEAGILAIKDFDDRVLECDSIKATLPRIVSRVGLEKRLIPWMMYAKDENLRRNAKDVFKAALLEKKNNSFTRKVKEIISADSKQSKLFLEWINSF